METVTISSKYQLVVPKKARESLDLRPGMRLSVVAKGGILYLVPEEPIKKARGAFKGLRSSGFRDKKDRV